MWRRTRLPATLRRGRPKAPGGRRRTSPSERIRILAVQPSLEDNGGLRVLLDLLDRWHGVPGVLPHLFVVKQLVEGNVVASPHLLPVSEGTRAGARTRSQGVRVMRRLIRLTRSSDVVLSASEVGVGLLLGYLAARLVGRPFVVLVQADVEDALATWVSRPLRPAMRWANAHADALVCVSDGLVDPVLRLGAPPAAVHVVTNGIDVASVRRGAGLDPDTDEPSTRSRGGSDVPVVVAVGRLAVQKGFDLLVEAHARVLALGLEHCLVIIGDGPLRADLEELVARLGLTGTVSLPGFTANPLPAMAAADVFVLSSRSEGLPLTLLEALALGTPVIATECGRGTRTVLGDSEFGQVVASDCAGALAEAIATHLRTPAALRDRARSGPARARAFDPDRAAAEHLSVLRQVARQGRAAGPSASAIQKPPRGEGPVVEGIRR